MKILAVETSCDDTGIAILEVTKIGGFNVLSNVVASQIEVHKKYGGVYPMLAKREHQKNLVPTLKLALRKADMLGNPKSQLPNPKQITNYKFKIINDILFREPELEKKLISFLKKNKKPDIDLISVTNGPGLEPCLWVGVNFAKALSYFWNIPTVPVNHVESHILVNFLENPKVKFPAVCLVVSGGHTQIILMNGIGKYKILGETRDDAAGECFDKCAKILGLGYPGGPAIAELSQRGKFAGDARLRRQNPASPCLPRPMIGTKDYDFSFSGLKTAVLYSWQKINSGRFFADRQKTGHEEIVTEMASEVQQAIIDVLLKKTIKAAKDYKAKSIILGGGVSANAELRKHFLQKPGICKILFPKPDLSTDNGLMTAITGFYHKNKTVDWQDIKADGNLRIPSVK